MMAQQPEAPQPEAPQPEAPQPAAQQPAAQQPESLVEGPPRTRAPRMGLPPGLTLTPERLLGNLRKEEDREDQPAPLDGAAWYTATAIGDGLEYRFPAGALAAAQYLTADLLVDGNLLAVFLLTLQEGEEGPAFRLNYGALNQCSARLRMPLEAVNQNRWRYEREGAWLKPMCGGQRVDLAKVDRMSITVLRKGPGPVRWRQTAVTATASEPPLLEELTLPRGPLLDELGQSTLHDWPARTRSAEDVTNRLHEQRAAAPAQSWPEGFTRYGGWSAKKMQGSGFFDTYHDGRRWWLLDPDGYIFWSAGLDCVRVNTDAAYGGLEKALSWMPERDGAYGAIYSGRRQEQPLINYLKANFIRAFGSQHWYDRWAEISLGFLRGFGFNTVANWSDWQIARAAGFPYVRPLDLHLRHTPAVYRDFPDVFHPGFEADTRHFAEQLKETAGDPALIGYFLMNEPTWGFAQETPAAGMLYTCSTCPARVALRDFLHERHGGNVSLSSAWGMDVSFQEIGEGDWTRPLTAAARQDLSDFSAVMVERLFSGLSQACRQVDPDHLNLGARYYTVPPEWVTRGMDSFDVFSMNCYDRRIRAADVERISQTLNRPVLIGEWHFGALDVGLPGSGIGHVKDQAARGQAYRVYVEDAASHPACVGVHYFTMYDESALGRFDGENWNIGFLDVCNRPYDLLAHAARITHARLYPVALGETEPFNDEPEYLPLLFL